jgi:hypothetical protein
MFSGEIERAGKTNSPKNVPDPGRALRFLQSRNEPKSGRLPEFVREGVDQRIRRSTAAALRPIAQNSAEHRSDRPSAP